ncbi:CIA30 family protein [Pseudohongiella acticola]|uniref:CIA30 family protein n=1 Tax=Pseudohongiella acticola TaxID=1524254 RepID=UPI0030EECEB2
MNTESYQPLTLMDFAEPESSSMWQAINDDVMGGESQGEPQVVDQQLHFQGDISLANNGGFASVRARGQHHDLSAADSVLIRIKGDGRSYQFRLYTKAHFQGSRIAYATSFQTIDNEWLELRLHFSQLQPVFRGRTLSGPAFSPADVEEMGFMLVDKREGPFKLVVDWIRAA